MTEAKVLLKQGNLLRKLLAATVGFAGLLMLVGGLILTVYQVAYTFRYLHAIVSNSDLKAVATHTPAWARIFMVDLAVVAQALVFVTGLCVSYGAVRVLWQPAGLAQYVAFPFPRRYRTYFVQAGLWGTVVGFVIGFSNVSRQSGSDQAPLVLLAALSASLWSTLTAITLAYGVCPLIEIIFRKCLVPLGNADEDPLEKLRTKADSAALALERLTATSSAADLSLGLRTVADELTLVRQGVAETIDNFRSTNSRVSSLERELTNANGEINKLRVSIDASRENLKTVRQDAETLRTEIAERDRRNHEELASLQSRVGEMLRSFISDRQRWHKETSRVVQTGGALIERLRRSLEE